jgi:hypothetical protein
MKCCCCQIKREEEFIAKGQRNNGLTSFLVVVFLLFIYFPSVADTSSDRQMASLPTGTVNAHPK